MPHSDCVVPNKSSPSYYTKMLNNRFEDSFLNINDILSDILGGIRKKTLTLHTSAQIKEKIYLVGLILLLVLTLLISAFSFIFSMRLNKKFKNISKELFDRSNEITTVVTSLKKSSDSLGHAITEQSHSIHDTTAAINQMTSTVNNTTGNTKELYEVSKSSSEKPTARSIARFGERSTPCVIKQLLRLNFIF